MLKNVVHNNQRNSSFSLCGVIMQNSHSILKEINFMFEVNTSALLPKTWGLEC